MKTMQGNAQGLGMFRTVVGVTTIGVLLGACTVSYTHLTLPTTPYV